MRIGLDLDNTILGYIDLFHQLACEQNWISPDCIREKQAIKDDLARVAGDADRGELRWQQLQAWTYGEHISKAILFDGFIPFMKRVRREGHTLFIVSHKSETSNYDRSVNLREHALRTLTERGFFDELGFEKEKVFFEGTRDDKVNRINQLGLDCFIDDLPSVLTHPNFPNHTQPILFSDKPHLSLPACASWNDITDLVTSLPHLPGNRITRWRPFPGGNNRIREVAFVGGERMAVKHYLTDPDDPRPRRDSEWKFLNLLWSHGFTQIPQPNHTWSDGSSMGLIEGSSPKDISDDNLPDYLLLLRRLDEIGGQAERDQLNMAADARIRPIEWLEAVARRSAQTVEACEREGLTSISAFLTGPFESLKQTASHTFESVCSQADIEPDHKLPFELWFPSPSDLGPHNTVVAGDRLVFLDFEYAGWDDPAKLLADFLHHVAHQTPAQTRLTIIRGFVQSRERDPKLWSRLRAIADLVALEWILIVLNVTLPHIMRRKQFAHASDRKALIQTRFEKAQLMAGAFVPFETLIEETS